MTVRVLLTAFEAYDGWKVNASWNAVVQLTRELPSEPEVTTRLYPVDFQSVRSRLEHDLLGNYDLALHLGQAPGTSRIQLEAIGINVGGHSSEPAEAYRPLVDDGPVAFRSQLPLDQWATLLRRADIPATVSFHAGTFLCNAVLYLSHYLNQRMGNATQVGFIHLPLAPEQTVGRAQDLPHMTTPMVVAALRLILKQLVHPAA